MHTPASQRTKSKLSLNENHVIGNTRKYCSSFSNQEMMEEPENVYMHLEDQCWTLHSTVSALHPVIHVSIWGLANCEQLSMPVRWKMLLFTIWDFFPLYSLKNFQLLEQQKAIIGLRKGSTWDQDRKTHSQSRQINSATFFKTGEWLKHVLIIHTLHSPIYANT